MAGLKQFKSASLLVLCTWLLVGFSGQEKYMELSGYLNARSSGSFLSSDRNVLTLLPRGTRGEILSYKRFQSGNYGLKVRVLSGQKTGQVAWMYYNVRDPDMAVYKTTPQNWDKNKKEVSAVEQARGTETLRETPLFPEPDQSNDRQAAQQAVDIIQRTNFRAQEVGRPSAPTTPSCQECSTNVAIPKPVTIYPGKKSMSNQCSAIIDARGRVGSTGKSLMSIMSENRYMHNFTASNAMGSLCPRFNTLSKTQKLQAWTWFWAALGQEESGCQLKKVHRTTYRDRRGRVRILNPREGYGIWAMERDRLVRRHRGAACKDISTAAGQARCSIDIMNKRQLSKGRSLTNDSGSYWGPVRRARKQLEPHMRRFSVCF